MYYQWSDGRHDVVYCLLFLRIGYVRVQSMNAVLIRFHIAFWYGAKLIREEDYNMGNVLTVRCSFETDTFLLSFVDISRLS